MIDKMSVLIIVILVIILLFVLYNRSIRSLVRSRVNVESFLPTSDQLPTTNYKLISNVNNGTNGVNGNNMNNGTNKSNKLLQGRTMVNGDNKVIISDKGQLELYNSDKLVWNSNNKESSEPHYLIIQTDGNLCLYNNDHESVWCSQTKNEGKEPWSVILNDSNLCIYDSTDKPTWCSRTQVMPTNVSNNGGITQN